MSEFTARVFAGHHFYLNDHLADLVSDVEEKIWSRCSAPDPYTRTVDLETDLTFANRNVGNQRRTGMPTEEPLMRSFSTALHRPAGDPGLRRPGSARRTRPVSAPHQHRTTTTSANLHCHRARFEDVAALLTLSLVHGS